jgi:hypothetical protein
MTTGSTVNGTVQGMANGLGGGGVSGLDIGTLVNVEGSPDGVVQAIMASQIAWDGINAQPYQAGAIGSTWYKLGSVA